MNASETRVTARLKIGTRDHVEWQSGRDYNPKDTTSAYRTRGTCSPRTKASAALIHQPATAMNTIAPTISLELRVPDGGNIEDMDLYRTARLLDRLYSLDHTSHTPDTLTAQHALTYVILHRGIPLFANNPHDRPVRFYKDDEDYWIAGICALYFPNLDDKSTAEIVIALLPEARQKGCGRLAVQKVVEYAFDALRIRRLTAPIVCPVRPDHSAGEKKRAMFETKRLCWVFERYGFQFEGVSRGAVKDPRTPASALPVWYDVHRMSMLDTDYFSNQVSAQCTREPSLGALKQNQLIGSSPWESMARRHEEEKWRLAMWADTPVPVVTSNTSKAKIVEDEDDAEYYNSGGSDDWEDPEDFD
jgi:RimJ/RimL family protein N-acetyltransferase